MESPLDEIYLSIPSLPSHPPPPSQDCRILTEWRARRHLYFMGCKFTDNYMFILENKLFVEKTKQLFVENYITWKNLLKY